MIRTIEAFVLCEAIDKFVDLLLTHSAGIATPKRFGNHLRLDFHLPGENKSGRILGLGHSDTVWDLGTLASMPYSQRDGRLWGPGVLDMKAGIVFFLFAARALRDLNRPVQKEVSLLIVADEEIGSKDSRPLTESEAKSSDYVLVLEPGTSLAGHLKTARKGISGYRVRVNGRASHAGVDFEAGASAIVELAHQIERIASFTDLDRGITVNPGVIHGGTRANVVAAEAQVDVDVRVSLAEDAVELDRKFQALTPFDGRCSITISGGVNRPPMERSAAIGKLFEKAKGLASEINLQIQESSTGGGSDGNFTAALGIPTLDGLGAVGEGAHAQNESILVDRIADRTALLAGLLSSL